MQIVIESHDASDDDCLRRTYTATVNGEEFWLAPCALGTKYTAREIMVEARKHFGADVEIDWNDQFRPDEISYGMQLEKQR